SEFTEQSTLQCPACSIDIHVGMGRHKNLDIHKGSKACQIEYPMVNQKPNQSLLKFFKPNVPQNAPLVSQPLPIHAPDIRSRQLITPTNNLKVQVATTRSEELPHAPVCLTSAQALEPISDICQSAPATTEHCLFCFGEDPAKSIDPNRDNWEDLLNPMLKNAFGWGEEEMHESVKEMMNRGNYGLDGFVRFLLYFMMYRGLKGGMFESKVVAVLEELELKYVR
ncbi:hypothetical protein L208DRAFT_1283552, partial [Tricholoma matsutake]